MSIRLVALLISLALAAPCVGQTGYTVQPFAPHGLPLPPPVLDTFNRADGAVGAQWIQDAINAAGSMIIATNQVTRSTGGDGSAVWTTTTVGPHQVACLSPSVLADGVWDAVFVRVVNPDTNSMTGYSLQMRKQAATDNLEIYEWAAGTPPAKAQLGADINAEFTLNSDIVCLEAVDATLNALVCSPTCAVVGSRTDSTLAGTAGQYLGIGSTNTANRSDDFRGASE